MAENSQVNANTFSQQLSKYMQEIVSHDVDTLILGCTHFSCFKETIALKSSLNLVDSSQCCLKELNLQMPTVNCKAVQEDRFLVTKDANSFLQKLKFQQIEARFVETVKF